MTARFRRSRDPAIPSRRTRGHPPTGGAEPPFAFFTCAVQPSRQPVTHLHRHGGVEIGFCHAGRGVLLVEGRVLPYAAPCVALIAAEDWHFHHSAPGTISDWTFAFVDPARLLAPGDPGIAIAATLRGPRFPHVCGPDQPALIAIGEALAELCRRRGVSRDDAFTAGARGLVSALIAEASRLTGRDGARGAVGQAARERLLPALRLIAASHGEALPVPRLARAAGLAPSAFRVAFARAFGVGPKAYVTRFRLEKAAAALDADPRARVLDVALDCGFASLSAFNRQYRALFQRAPRRG
ncbi:MAG TPA: AraC family transcriptional regulator [Planctomycetota bacterium]|nr:AraC family transcriptional regulator [Planctomycetota bacterium]